MRRSSDGFTLTELLVSLAVLTLIVLFVSSMVSSATKVTTLGYKKMDTDSQVRPVLGRMAVDFSQMIKRPEADYYAKSPTNPEAGNDRIAFFCNVAGYYPSTGSPSSISLVAYRINAGGPASSLSRMQRMSKGLLWNGSSNSVPSMLFGLQAISNNWTAATDDTSPDDDYELVGPQIFRFEYFYLLKTGLISDAPGAPGMQEVAAICVSLAAIDQQSRALLSDSQITTLAGRLVDFDPSKPHYDLTANWRSTLDAITDMPRVAVNGVRIYQRYFAVNP